MDKGFIETDKRMSAAGMPHAAFRGIALMGDPDMGIKIFKLIVLCHLLGITDDLQDHHVPAVRKDKGLLITEGAVKSKIQLIGILIDTFFFCLILWEHLKVTLLLKSRQGFRFNADKISFHLWRFYVEPFNVPVIVDAVDKGFVIDSEKGFDEFRFQFGNYCFVKERDLEKKILIEGLLVDTQFLRGKSDCGKSAALAVSTIVHLY